MIDGCTNGEGSGDVSITGEYTGVKQRGKRETRKDALPSTSSRRGRDPITSDPGRSGGRGSVTILYGSDWYVLPRGEYIGERGGGEREREK